MSRDDVTPYDGPSCERCGQSTERDTPLCDDCAEEQLELRRAEREMAASERSAA